MLVVRLAGGITGNGTKVNHIEEDSGSSGALERHVSLGDNERAVLSGKAAPQPGLYHLI
jgi:hypothetical protein